MRNTSEFFMFSYPINGRSGYLCGKTATMRTQTFWGIPAAVLLCIGFGACQDTLTGQEGSIRVKIAASKSLSLPDTEDYILSIRDSDGGIIYEGRFGDSPEEVTVPKGVYTVSAVSETFEQAGFDAPQFGDSEEVVVGAGDRVSASLVCTQTNSGIRLRADESFIDAFPDGVLYIKGGGDCLMYGYTERRTAYFRPGKLTVSVSESGDEQTLFTKTLGAAECLSLRLSATSGTAEGISIRTDTTRSWLSESFTYGDDAGSDDISDALDIAQARESAGFTGVWVKGYIVGCATGSGKYEFDAPFSRATNLLLGLRSGTADGQWCISVELKSKKIREALNLADNPELDGRYVYIKGDLVSSYYGLPGLKNVSEYQWTY